MRDPIIEEIFQRPDRERTRQRARIDPVVPAASRYPRSAKRAELERERLPWAQQDRTRAQAPPPTPYL